VQYSHLCGPLALWHVQTAYGSRPWAVEMPSAGWMLTSRSLRALRRRGIGVAPVTHAAGLSSTGDALLDALLPLPERFDIPPATVREIDNTRKRGGRIVAVGTSVVRAIEGGAAMNGGRLRAGLGVTNLRVGPGFVPRLVDGVLSGMHEPGTSHFQLLGAFAPTTLLEAAYHHAEAIGYLGHEFGDTSLVLAA
jgi:S-adenosylmethionine:tRNA ribosyltransferase-isomerase